MDGLWRQPVETPPSSHRQGLTDVAHRRKVVCPPGSAETRRDGGESSQAPGLHRVLAKADKEAAVERSRSTDQGSDVSRVCVLALRCLDSVPYGRITRCDPDRELRFDARTRR